MRFQFLAVIAGGKGPDVWDKEVTVAGENITLHDAVHEVDRVCEEAGDDAAIVSIEQWDEPLEIDREI